MLTKCNKGSRRVHCLVNRPYVQATWEYQEMITVNDHRTKSCYMSWVSPALTYIVLDFPSTSHIICRLNHLRTSYSQVCSHNFFVDLFQYIPVVPPLLLKFVIATGPALDCQTFPLSSARNLPLSIALDCI